MANQAEVAEVIGMLMDAYPGREFQNLKGFVMTAARLLGDFSAAELRTAAEAHIQNSRFFPTVAELRTAAKRLPVRSQGQQERPMGPLDRAFVDLMGRLERMRPEMWTFEDYKRFEAAMGRAVNFERDDPAAPWMAWKLQGVGDVQS